ncbi:MAG: pilus assembly protein [Alcaligenaceae bacterium]|nr:pilus assembly protein [Alcaligenaceae bacterium]
MRNAALSKTQKNQQGVAAIEFALVITLLLTVCFAIVSFGMLMWAQQKVSHIAGDSARVALQQSIQGNTGFVDAACTHAKTMAAADFILGGLVDLNDPSKNKVDCLPDFVSCAWDATQSCLSLTMTVTVDGLPLVNMVQAVGNIFSNNTDGWVPEKLSATSVVKITEL